MFSVYAFPVPSASDRTSRFAFAGGAGYPEFRSRGWLDLSSGSDRVKGIVTGCQKTQSGCLCRLQGPCGNITGLWRGDRPPEIGTECRVEITLALNGSSPRESDVTAQTECDDRSGMNQLSGLVEQVSEDGVGLLRMAADAVVMLPGVPARLDKTRVTIQVPFDQTELYPES